MGCFCVTDHLPFFFAKIDTFVLYVGCKTFVEPQIVPPVHGHYNAIHIKQSQRKFKFSRAVTYTQVLKMALERMSTITCKNNKSGFTLIRSIVKASKKVLKNTTQEIVKPPLKLATSQRINLSFKLE